MLNKKSSLLLLPLLVLVVGCTNVQQPAPKKVAPKVSPEHNQTKHAHVPAPPKKEIELKEVEDTNFSSEYMYPTTKKKKKKTNKKVEKAPSTTVGESTGEEIKPETTPKTNATDMSKAECISMIGQEKFDKYTQMYGGEAASIKKCKMLKSM